MHDRIERQRCLSRSHYRRNQVDDVSKRALEKTIVSLVRVRNVCLHNTYFQRISINLLRLGRFVHSLRRWDIDPSANASTSNDEEWRTKRNAQMKSEREKRLVDPSLNSIRMDIVTSGSKHTRMKMEKGNVSKSESQANEEMATRQKHIASLSPRRNASEFICMKIGSANKYAANTKIFSFRRILFLLAWNSWKKINKTTFDWSRWSMQSFAIDKLKRKLNYSFWEVDENGVNRQVYWCQTKFEWRFSPCARSQWVILVFN